MSEIKLEEVEPYTFTEELATAFAGHLPSPGAVEYDVDQPIGWRVDCSCGSPLHSTVGSGQEAALSFFIRCVLPDVAVAALASRLEVLRPAMIEAGAEAIGVIAEDDEAEDTSFAIYATGVLDRALGVFTKGEEE